MSEGPREPDPNLAPAGFFATPKATANPPGVTANICRQCDWRPECLKSSPTIDEMPAHHNCRGYALTGKDGIEYCRADGVSVVFKRRHDSPPIQTELFE